MYEALEPWKNSKGNAVALQPFVDNPPVRVGALDFGVMSEEEVQRQSQTEISDRNIYNLDVGRTPTVHGPLDLRLGTSTKITKCSTCHEDQRKCNGHWGYVRLEAACFHIGYLAFTIDILNQVCKNCSRILIPEVNRQTYLRQLHRLDVDSFQKRALIRKIQHECKKVRSCPHCNSSNGPVRKVAGHACKLMHLKFEFFHRSTARSKQAPQDKVLFDYSMDAYAKSNPESARHMKRVVDDLPAIKVHRIFCSIPTEDCDLLGLDPNNGRPESYLWTYLPVPPSNIRPSVPGDQGTTEDELTTKLSEIIDLNSRLKVSIEKDETLSIQMDYYEKLQDHIAMYINSHAPGLNKSEYGKAIRSFCSRLKGKQGRFRGNLSGKRVNFSGRTVISPDPNLSVEEVGIPIHVAKILSYPVTVTRYNKEKLKEMVCRGSNQYPGANTIKKKRGTWLAIRVQEMLGKHIDAANDLQIGDVVHRHLVGDDIVLFNRQPSLHKLSILCHKVRIHTGRTFRFNESVCIPYNADFDGDEMNIHVPQTEEARAEALELMGVKHNLVTPKDGAPIIAPIQDFITAAYLISNKDRFFTKVQFTQIMGWMFDAQGFKDPDTGEWQTYDLPPPSICKPQYLWTGKQIFNVLMRPSKKCKVLVNVETALREFNPISGLPPDFHPFDLYLVVQNSEIMCGHMDKKAVGEGGNKTSIFYVMLRDFGQDYAVQGMNRLAKLSSRWLSQQGFSIGVGDVYPSKNLEERKSILITNAYETVRNLIDQFKSGSLTRLPGCTEEQTLESKISKLLSDVRNDAGAACFEELSRHNAAVIMAKSGSKGSMINVSQMTAGVGQQTISQKRVENGFQDRTLPHFPKGARDPASKGFVKNSFFSGLTPTEFLFHAMSGREGLVDTAVKTAETGYMSRRLIKSLEDAYVVYDSTVRNSGGNVIQFSFGDDYLDPAQLEGQRQPVNFERTWAFAMESTRNYDDMALNSDEIRQISSTRLDIEGPKLIGRFRHEKQNSDGSAFDSHESIRRFLHNTLDFIAKIAAKLEVLQSRQRKNKLSSLDSSKSRSNRGRPPKSLTTINASSFISAIDSKTVKNQLLKVSKQCLDRFLDLCLQKYLRSVAEPGHAVGAIAAQSIGEPGTQMTLRTFHFSGVAGMSITQGVPRIKEIINAAKKISTPVITCKLENKTDERIAQIVKGKIEKTYLRDIAEWIEDYWSEHRGAIYLGLNVERVSGLELSEQNIKNAILRTKGLKLSSSEIVVLPSSTKRTPQYIRISPDELEFEDEDVMDVDKDMDIDEVIIKPRSKKRRKTSSYFLTLQDLKRAILNVVVKGYPDTNRAIIRRTDRPDTSQLVTKQDRDKDKDKDFFELLVEGYGLKACMNTPGVDGTQTTTNSVMETASVLGIEAARSVIISEIQSVMANMNIDAHHMSLLACIMTHKGEVLGITRFGMVKMGDSVLQLASFEKTPDHLFEAATRMKSDPITGVSESIIMGQTVRLGTGATSVVRPLGLNPNDFKRKEPGFDTAWKGQRVLEIVDDRIQEAWRIMYREVKGDVRMTGGDE